MTKRELTCIICPMGCPLEIGLNDKGEVEYVKGNTCKRGEKYAIGECTNPERVITSTVYCTDGSVVPVKTNTAIPKNLIFECMDEINKVQLTLPVHMGDVVIKNVLGTGADIIAAANKN